MTNVSDRTLPLEPNRGPSSAECHHVCHTEFFILTFLAIKVRRHMSKLTLTLVLSQSFLFISEPFGFMIR
jgi:hypothetical protein